MRVEASFSRNNLDCLRLFFASIVVFYHVYALTNISAFSSFDAIFSPHFAVRGFFVISGLLIYRSYTRSSSISSYFEKRIRRIYPAYFTVILLAAILLPPLSATYPAQSYGLGFWKYLGANLVFLNFLAPALPGVFTSHINPAVNGALWTLKIEVVFYLAVPLIHYLCVRYGVNRVIGLLFSLSLAWKFGFHALSAAHPSIFLYDKMQVEFPAQLNYFCAGILLLVYFDSLKRHFVAISIVTAGLFLLDHFFTGEKLDVLWISGFVFVLGFWKHLGNFSKYGDFSYGVYILHWPILQTMISFGLTAINPALFLLMALSLICLASFLMWKLVESRFLASSSHYREAQQVRA